MSIKERELKIKEYKEYIKEHQEFVKKIWKEIQGFCKGEFWLDDYTYFNIDAAIKEHDKSKFNHQEFYPYKRKFYPTKKERDYPEEEINKGFSYAWNAHQKENPHHWEYWITVYPTKEDGKLDTMRHIVPLEMEFEYMFEMLCDWSAMSLKFGDLPSKFYEEYKEKMILHEKTRKSVERYLKIFDKCVSDIRGRENYER